MDWILAGLFVTVCAFAPVVWLMTIPGRELKKQQREESEMQARADTPLIPCANHDVHPPHSWRHPDSRAVECMGVDIGRPEPSAVPGRCPQGHERWPDGCCRLHPARPEHVSHSAAPSPAEPSTVEPLPKIGDVLVMHRFVTAGDIGAPLPAGWSHGPPPEPSAGS